MGFHRKTLNGRAILTRASRPVNARALCSKCSSAAETARLLSWIHADFVAQQLLLASTLREGALNLENVWNAYSPHTESACEDYRWTPTRLLRGGPAV